MTVAPVMLFTYSRPQHTRSVIEALEANHIAGETTVYAYTCEPKNASHSANVNATKKVLEEFSKNSKFSSFNIVDMGEHVPLGPAMIRAINEVMEKHDRIIIVEDDIVTSKDFLSFMNECLDFYENDKTVFSVSGYSPDVSKMDRGDKDVYAVHRACPWGWGTWKNRWDLYDPEVKEYQNNMLNRNFRTSLTTWTTDLPMTLDALFYEEGCFDKNWEQQFCFCQFLNGMNAVCPKISKVKNIGFDGTGTHLISLELASSFIEEGSVWKLEPLEVDARFQKKYNKQFVARTRTKILIRFSNLVHFISPSLFYRLLRKYYHTPEDKKEITRP